MDLLSERAGAQENKEVILESGFSLSEQAHEDDVAPTYISHDEPLSSSSSSPPQGNETASISTTGMDSIESLRQRVVDDVVGHPNSATNIDNQHDGPSVAKVVSPLEFQAGKPVVLPLVYCDFTASHQPLTSIESYLTQQCLPFYGNTHTNTSLTGSQSTAFCSEARQIVGEFCGAKTTGKASQDVVLFAGNGTTSAVELLIDCLGLKHHILHMNIHNDDVQAARPVVFVGPFEHHSNLLPWRELGQVDIEMVHLDPTTGNVNLQHLQELLEKYAMRKVKIGAFSAASNVTGAIADDITITALLHQHGALSVWDYATGASYLDVQMNPRHPDYSHAPELLAKDAIVLSGHKLLGGVGTPGVLIIKKHLVSQQNPPSRSGGGTVFYVTDDHHRFLSNRIERFEGGTPNIVGIWRLGLALTAKVQLKKQFERIIVATDKDSLPRLPQETNALLHHDIQRAKKIQMELSRIPNLVLMDESYSTQENYNKLPVFSFLIKCGTRFLHYNYVCAILNDVFGIQSRGGCQCAGPFAQYLLGLHGEVNLAVEECLVHTKDELLRPGFTRLSLPTFGTTDAMEDYVIKAIAWVAQNGWKLMHVYRCNHRTGDWRHKSRPGAPLGKTQRKWLSHYRNQSLNLSSAKPHQSREVESVPSLNEAFTIANQLLQLVVQDHSSLMQAVKMSQETDEDSSTLTALRWYVYPKEVGVFLQQGLDEVPGTSDRSNIVGAIRPIAWFPINDSPITVANDQDTKAVIVDDQPATLPQPISPSLKDTKTASTLDYNAWMSFQDGEHTGQAPLDEIIAGYEEGELSADCIIYNIESDEWEKIDLYLARNNTPVVNPPQNTTTTAIVSEVTTSHNNADKVPAPPNPLPTSLPGPVSISLSDVPVIEKNAKKKPQRHSAAWGQGTMVPIHPPSCNITASPPPSSSPPAPKSKRHKHIKPPPKLMRLVTQAMIQWDMLEEGDRLLLGLSGGKDSLTLLHLLLEFQKKLPIKFDIEVCTIDPMTPSFDPSPLIPYVESLGLKYHYIRDDIVERANRAGKDGKVVSSLCSYCARMKRGHLYACARQNNCNKLVLAQHLDDLAESFMMSVMHNGFLRTMKANYKINAGDLSVIRPLVYCRESMTAEFARSHLQGLLVNENCPACFEEPKERARIKKLLSKEETLYPNFYDNIKRSLLPLMHDDATAILRSYTEEALDKSRKESHKKVVRPRPTSTTTTSSGSGEEEKKENHSEPAIGESPQLLLLSNFSDEELVKELARRRAASFRLAGAMKRTDNDDDDEADPTGQICSLRGGNGTIPCRELME